MIQQKSSRAQCLGTVDFSTTLNRTLGGPKRSTESDAHNTWGEQGFIMADELLKSAIENWGPRFVTNGIDYSDYRKLVTTIDNWSQWCNEWSKVASIHENLGREALEDKRYRSAGVHLSQAATYYHFAKFLFFDDMDQYQKAHEQATTCLRDALAHLSPPGRVVEVPYKDSHLVGILRSPDSSQRMPTVMMIPGLDSTKEEFRSTEQLFLDRGLATFSVDGPGQGESEHFAIEPNWEIPGDALLDSLAKQPEVNPDRIGVWGVSLGGYYSARVASTCKLVKAAIDLSGPYDFGENWDNLPQLTREAFRIRSKSQDNESAKELAAKLSLAEVTRKIKIPFQLVFGAKDRLFPVNQAHRLADEAPGLDSFLLFDDGNHGCANIAYKHRSQSADWMAKHLLG